MHLWLFGPPHHSPWDWLTENPITKLFGGGETGIDLGTPFHTLITALVPGKVVGMGYYGGGGVVSTESDILGKKFVFYYQHLDLIDPNLHIGQDIGPGTNIGLSGGQLSGGYHPSDSRYSNGPHTEIGINPPYGGMWNPHHIGPNINPVPFIADVLGGKINLPPITTGGGLFNPVQAFFDAFHTNAVDFAWRLALIAGGMTLIVVGMIVFFSHQEQQAGTVVIEQAGNAAKAAGAAAAA